MPTRDPAKKRLENHRYYLRHRAPHPVSSNGSGSHHEARPARQPTPAPVPQVVQHTSVTIPKMPVLPARPTDSPALLTKVQINLHLPQYFASYLEELLLHTQREDGAHVWRSRTQMMQDLLTRGIDAVVQTQTPEEDGRPDAVQRFRTLRELETTRQQRRDIQTAFAVVQTELQELLRIQALDDAVRYYRGAMAAFQALEPTVWRDWFLTELPKRFPDLGRRKPKPVRLDDVDPLAPPPPVHQPRGHGWPTVHYAIDNETGSDLDERC